MKSEPLKVIADRIGKSVDAVRQRRFTLRGGKRVTESPYPRYDKPTKVEADNCLILPDIELPFHNADFINRVIDQALSWRVDTLIAAGDMFHLEMLSGWEPNLKAVQQKYIDEKTKDRLNETFLKIKDEKLREECFSAIDELDPKMDDTFAEEVYQSKKIVTALNCFKERYHIMGNHEGRLLRTIGTDIEGGNLADIFGMTDWHMSEYYFAELTSAGELYRIAHPKPYAKTAAAEMASRFLCHYVMGHSHDLSMRKDRSGKFWAISMGHCADETRFPYESQRDRTYWSHVNGAVIVTDGYPWLITDEFPFGKVKR